MPSKSLEYPFGPYVNTLVVCHNEQHRKHVIEAFGLQARYVMWGASLMGSRFDKVIAFMPYHVSPRDEDYIETQLKTKLSRDGKFFLV